MKLDDYWKGLVKRIFQEGYKPKDAEDDFYRLTCIYGETMVDGIESYFERRYMEFDADMKVLIRHGFNDIAADYCEAQKLIFGEAQVNRLTWEEIWPILRRLMGTTAENKPIRDGLGKIYERLIVSVPGILTVRDKIGIENKFFEDENSSTV